MFINSPFYFAIAMVLVTLGIATSEELWPVLSCHPVFDVPPGLGNMIPIDEHRYIWRSCHRSTRDDQHGYNLEWKCDKLCQLGKFRMVTQHWSRTNGSTGPVSFDIDEIVNYMAEENRYVKGHGGVQADKLKNKVKVGMTDCWQKHQEVKNMNVFDVCDKWNPFLSCIGSAFGCE